MTYLPVQKDGLLDLDVLRKAMRPDTSIVSVMSVNNEIGGFHVGVLHVPPMHRPMSIFPGGCCLSVITLSVITSYIHLQVLFSQSQRLGASAELAGRSSTPTRRRCKSGGGGRHGVRNNCCTAL